MSLRLITGKAGSGKTTYLLDEIRSRLLEKPLGAPLMLIVPEQATFQAEYALATTPGMTGFIRAQALSFRRLAFRVMQEQGGSAIVPIQEQGKAMLLHRILESRRDRLRLFRGGAAETGLVAGLSELLTEMKRYGIGAAKLQKLIDDRKGYGGGAADSLLPAAGSLLPDKLHDLCIISADMERELSEQWLDGEDMLDWLAKGIAETTLLDDAEIWLDGFHGFTPMEYAVIDALLRRVKRVTVALCLDRPYGAGEMPDELDLFHQTALTAIRLSELAEAAKVPVEPAVRLEPDVSPRFRGNPMLAFLDRNWHNRKRWDGESEMVQPDHPQCGLSLHAAVNRRAEVEAVARDMLRRLREEGRRWREMIVYVRRVEDYADVFQAVFGDYGIPFFLDGKASALHHPLVEFVRSALECVSGGWKSEAVFRCAKTDLLRTHGVIISRDDIDRLENYCLAIGIDGWRWHDLRVWRPLARGDLEDQSVTTEAEMQLDKLLFIREQLVGPLLTMERRMKQAKTVRDLCEALYLFLEDTGAADTLESWSVSDGQGGQPARMAAHRPLWDSVLNLLDQLVELMGEQPKDMQLFAGMIDSGLEELRLGAVPPSLDGVMIGNPERTRSDHVAIVYLLGTGDGVLPMRMNENGLLAEAEREQLAAAGLELAPGARRKLMDEAFLAYLMLTTASAHLWISYPQADDEGASLLPSEWIGRLAKRFPGMPITHIASEPQPADTEQAQLQYAAHPGRALTFLIAQLRNLRQGGQLVDGWWAVYEWLRARPQWKDRLLSLLASLNYTNAEQPLHQETSRLLYGDRLLASVSRMERFVSCPFQHFASHGLRLKERKLFRIDTPDIGQLYHAALRQTTEKLFAEGDAAREVARWQAEAAAAVERLLPEVQAQVLLSTHRHQAMARKLRNIVIQASAILGEQAARAAFKPVGLELSFGPDGFLPPLSLDLGGGRSMDVAGKIDRVDAADSPAGLLLRVMDYKSSGHKLRLNEVAHGLSLQMLAYLDVVVTHAPHWLGRPAQPAGVLYFHVHNPLLHTMNGMTLEEAQNALFREYRMQGLLLADGEAVTLMDDTLSSTSKSAIVPVEFKKDGAFSARSQVADVQQWDVLRRSVRTQMRAIGKRIVKGDVSIQPYKLDKRSPCTFCAYRPVCHIDNEVSGNEYRLIAKSRGPDEIWKRLAALSEEEEGR